MQHFQNRKIGLHDILPCTEPALDTLLLLAAPTATNSVHILSVSLSDFLSKSVNISLSNLLLSLCRSSAPRRCMWLKCSGVVRFTWTTYDGHCFQECNSSNMSWQTWWNMFWSKLCTLCISQKPYHQVVHACCTRKSKITFQFPTP